MTLLARYRFALSGWAGGPGVTTFYMSEGTTGGGAWPQAVIDDAYEEIASTVDAFKGIWAGSIVGTLEPEVALFDPATGETQDVKTYSQTPISITSVGTGQCLARATQLNVRLSTDIFIKGRRLRGRHFVGPLGLITDPAGSFSQATCDNIADAYTGITTGIGTRLAVWHRPSVKGLSDGTWGDVTAVAPQRKPAVLTSRRD